MKKKPTNITVILSDVAFPVLMVAIFVLTAILTSNGNGFSQSNFVMLNISFMLIILSYFFGLIGSLIMSTATIFAICSWHLYNNMFNGIPISTNLYYWSAFILAGSVLAGIHRHSISKMQNEIISAKRTISSFSTIDKDTDLFNEKALTSDLTIFMNLAKRNELPVTLMVIRPKHVADLRRIIGADRFPYFLKVLSECIKTVIRYEDRMYLIDDECTFALILVTDGDGANVVADKIKDAVATNKFEDVVPPLRLDAEISVAKMVVNPALKMAAVDMVVVTKSQLEYDVSSLKYRQVNETPRP